MRKFKLSKMEIAKNEMTIKQGFNEFMRFKKSNNLSEYTLTYYEDQIKSFERFYSLDNCISTINESLIEDYAIFLKTELGVRDTTLRTHLIGIRTIVNYFITKGYLEKITVKLPKAEETLVKIYTQDEVDKLIKRPNVKTCTFGELRTWAMIIYFLGTGQRLNTVLNLKIKDVDLDNQVAILNYTKNRKQTILPLPTQVVETLDYYLKYRDGEDEDYLFCDWENKKLERRGAQIAIERYNKKRGVNKTSIHSFRHTFATNYLKNGGDIYRLKRLLCHSDIRVTEKYLHLLPEELAKDIDDLVCINIPKHKTKLKSKAR